MSLHIRNLTVLAVQRLEFVSDRMSCVILRGHMCNAIGQIAYAPTKARSMHKRDFMRNWSFQFPVS